MLQTFNRFMGELPRSAKRILPDQYAQKAANCRMEDGILAPVRVPRFITDLVTPRQTLYLNGATWLAYDGVVSVLPGPTATDRLYRFGDGVPKMTVNDTDYNLALPAPATAPAIANLTAPAADALETVLYVVTYVTDFGEESAPSPLSNALEWSEGVVVRLNGIPAPPAGRAITKMRVYRSNTSVTGTTDLFFVTELPYAAIYDHDLSLTPLNESIETADHNTPPDDLRGVVSMPNGMFVGHTDREILFSEPYQPHAWPTKYALLVDYDIMGLAAFGSQLAVMTKGTPYRGQGSHPDTFQLERIEEQLPCVSTRSIVDLGYAAVYASTDGLVSITGGNAQIISRGLFTPEQWHKMDPASIFADQHRGRYIFGFTGTLPTGPEKTGLIDLSGELPFFMRAGVTATAFYRDLRTNLTYFQDAVTNELNIWDDLDADAYLSMSWRSAPINIGFHVGFSVIYLEGTAHGPYAVTVVADGIERLSFAKLNEAQRLPSGFKAKEWEVYIEGEVEVEIVALATAMEKLANLP